MSYHQYRITINKQAQSKIMDSFPGEQWSSAMDVLESRGGCAILERRLITDQSIFELLGDSPYKGWIQVNDLVISPWEVFAEGDFTA